MNAQTTTQALDRELLNMGFSSELFLDESSWMESDLYEVEGAEDLFNEMSYTDFNEMNNEEAESPLYYKSVPLENTGSHLCPLGA